MIYFRCRCGKVCHAKAALIMHIKVCPEATDLLAMWKNDTRKFEEVLKEIGFTPNPQPIEEIAPVLAGRSKPAAQSTGQEMISIPLPLFKALMASTTLDFSMLSA